MKASIVILGVFAADAAFRAGRLPRMGETILGRSFALGPGGKGSNQAVAAARAGGTVHFLSKLGRDAFGAMALRLWEEAGVRPAVTEDEGDATGAAFIFLDEATGENAIIVCPGAAGTIGPADIEAQADLIRGAALFVTQLEQPMDAALAALRLARGAGVRTLLNPAPAADLPQGMLGLCDIVVPNETEIAALTGLSAATPGDAARAAEALRAQGAGAVLVTLGTQGALWCDGTDRVHIPAFDAGPVAETVGAGDAFIGAFAAALAEGRKPVEAARFGCAAAAIAVTRPGAAAAMPHRAEIDALLARA